MESTTITELWSRAMPKAFALREKTLKARPLLERDSHFLERDGQLIGLVSISGPGSPWNPTDTTGHIRALMVDPQKQHQGHGQALLTWAETELRQRGARRAVLGADQRHFFPGIPLDESAPTSLSFFERAGYTIEGRISRDFTRSLETLPELKFPPGTAVRPASELDASDVLEFVRREFPGRWPHDVGLALTGHARGVLALVIDSQVMGFAVAGLESDPVLPPAAMWDENCGLGPMGVAKALRGQGLGQTLLIAAMHDLRNRGGTNMGVDWTGLEGFYESVGFTAVRQYRHAHKVL